MIVPIGDTYYFKFTTRNFSTGAPFTLAGTPVISVYEENNATQITAGITLTADYDSVTGLNDVAIVASSANGYEVGKYYDAVITTGTVNSVSVVGEVVGHFRVGPAEDAGAGIPDVNVVSWLDTAAATPTTAGVPEVDVTHWNAIALATTNPLPNAAPDAAGGLPISDAGGLDLDTKLANTNEITVARMGALTDWIDGGRLDLILDAAATAAELAKVPKSDGTATWNSTALASINAEADTALSDFFTSAANLVDLIWDEVITGAAHNTANSAARFLREVYEGVGYTGEAQAGAAGSITLAAGESAVTDFFKYERIRIIDGTGAGQSRMITAYDGTTKVATVHRNWGTNPDSTSIYSIVGTESELIYVNGTAQTAGDLAALITILDTVADGIQADLSNGTDGLGALLTAIQAVMTTQMTESYAADGVAPTPAQAMFLIQQLLSEFAISGTTITVKKLDGATTAATLTLDDGTNPTSATRAT